MVRLKWLRGGDRAVLFAGEHDDVLGRIVLRGLAKIPSPIAHRLSHRRVGIIFRVEGYRMARSRQMIYRRHTI
ncbi:MAG TPA: hypothetical protein VMI94_06550 [Bryobacteraceae bacterium]|nr:hypothetical protein [Bryobacteraceae bacterium]